MIAGFSITVMYGQIVVHTTGLERPGLLWDQDHVAQGFAWDDGIVCFGIPDHDGMARLEVAKLEQEPPLSNQTLWAIAVPFEVTSGNVDVGTILLTKTIQLPPGNYQLVFEGCRGKSVDAAEYAFVVKLTFTPAHAPEFSIIMRGGELTTGTILRKHAKRA
jgi:Competence protein J (ComJ)